MILCSSSKSARLMFTFSICLLFKCCSGVMVFCCLIVFHYCSCMLPTLKVCILYIAFSCNLSTFFHSFPIQDYSKNQNTIHVFLKSKGFDQSLQPPFYFNLIPTKFTVIFSNYLSTLFDGCVQRNSID